MSALTSDDWNLVKMKLVLSLLVGVTSFVTAAVGGLEVIVSAMLGAQLVMYVESVVSLGTLYLMSRANRVVMLAACGAQMIGVGGMAFSVITHNRVTVPIAAFALLWVGTMVGGSLGLATDVWLIARHKCFRQR